MRAFTQKLITLGPFGLFLLAALDSAGVPLPGGVDALLVVLAIAQPESQYLLAICAIFGSAIGSLVLFWLARKGGQAYLRRQTVSPRGARMRHWFQRYGLLTVFVPALVPIPMPMKLFVVSAGAMGVHPLTFLGVIFAARIPRYFGLAYLGAELGKDAPGYLKAHAWHLVGVAVALFGALYLLLRIADKRRGGVAAAGGSEVIP